MRKEYLPFESVRIRWHGERDKYSWLIICDVAGRGQLVPVDLSVATAIVRVYVRVNGVSLEKKFCNLSIAFLMLSMFVANENRM